VLPQSVSGAPLDEQAWSEIRYTAYRFVIPRFH
jgi:hypothetical protein